ncbi:dystrophin-like [Dreissena polymorpha]|uniref:Dystrophin n=1 Tax=Dreissena polymorpha TaxID=45954 RepID=A0A9D4R032_DREPO|nr:dystrophin-like [Dreissena polymorpha]KAH3849152.1 hypothetical protein DPMN_091548 [Dreissena polymorpha]
MDEGLSLYDCIVEGWERTQTENGVPYFVNHTTENTSWNHPYWLKIVEDMAKHGDVKYAAYRTAIKVHHIQKCLKLHMVDLYTIQQEFEEAGLATGSQDTIGCDDLLTLLISIFGHTHCSDRQLGEVELLADITLNLLLNLFDQSKQGVVSVMGVKIILAVLSAGKLTDKYRFVYQEIHDPSTYIQDRSLGYFLNVLMKLPEFLHESLAFGRSTEPAITSCLQMGANSGGITEEVFYRWLLKEPQTLVWLPTMHRLIACQNVEHAVKCSVCKTYPMKGFRYKCLKCFNFSLCQSCFFTGKTKKSHKSKHPTQEYCTNSTAKDETAAFVKTLKNNLSRKQRRKSCIKYLPIEADNQYTNMAWSPGKEESGVDIHANISQTAQRLAEIEKREASVQTTPIHNLHIPNVTLFKENISPISPKNDGLQKQRDELNAVIEKLQEENRALNEQLCRMEIEEEDMGSDLFDSHPSSSFSDSKPTSPNATLDMRHIHRILRETHNLPIREPLPHETTPIYLSVPLISVSGFHRDAMFGSSHNSPLRSMPQPDFTILDLTHSPYSTHSTHSTFPTHSTYPTHSKFPNHTTYSTHSTYPTYSTCPTPSPARQRTLADSLDCLDTSPSRFSLPSPAKSSDEFSAEEAELRALVDEADRKFPLNLSYGRPVSSQSIDEDEMLRAANSIRQAMSDFVTQAVHPPMLPSLDLIIPT